MGPFRLAHAAAEDGLRAAEACARDLAGGASGPAVGFVYATDVVAADLARMVARLTEATGVEAWVGSVGIGICAGTEAYFDRPALAAMIVPVPEDSYRLVPNLSDSLDELPSDRRAWIDAATPPFGILHADPGNPKVPALIEALARETSGFLVGGLTSSRGASAQVAGQVTSGGLSGVLFSSRIPVATGLSQGCAPLGPVHVVSDCVDNVLIGLDGRPALEVLCRDLGGVAPDKLAQLAGDVHAALMVEGSDTGDYMVRTLVGADADRGWLAIGESVRPGTRVLFVRRDPASAADDLKSMLAGLKGRLAGPPRGGVYVSCIARGPHMFGAPGAEMAMVQDALGPLPVVGFYAGGEISNGRLYGYTGVLTLFL